MIDYSQIVRFDVSREDAEEIISHTQLYGHLPPRFQHIADLQFIEDFSIVVWQYDCRGFAVTTRPGELVPELRELLDD